MKCRRKQVAALVSVGVVLAALSSVPVLSAAATTSAPGVAAHTITLGLITSLTGVAASEEGQVVSAAQARVDVQNAHGGVDGRKIKLVTEDDHSSPATNLTASNALISKGVFGVIDDSDFAFGGYKVLEQDGVPVTGVAADGPEWGELPNTNMFSFEPDDPHEPATTELPLLFKRLGATSVATFAYGTSPLSAAAAKGNVVALQKVGLKSCYVDSSIPFGSVAAAPIALSMKSAGCDGGYLIMEPSTNFAILTAAKQAGVDMKGFLSATGYGQTLLTTSSASAAAQDTYFLDSDGIPVELGTKDLKAFQAALAKYAHWTGVPNYGVYEGWAATALMIKGLEVAGKDLSRTAFIKDLRKVKSFNATGVVPTINLTMKYFGKEPAKLCGYFVELKGNKFVPVPADGKPICGSVIPGSTQNP